MDTCFLIDLLRAHPGALKIARQEKHLRTTAISSAEFLLGAKKSGNRNLQSLSEKLIGYFPVLPFDDESAVVYADIACALSRKGRRISSMDELIAAIALQHTEPLVTRDRHFADIEGLETISY
ncbi:MULTISPECIES: type II toxin-antitoxin system VapC family toxin [unclassified Methanoregula]|uniref:type II toxin-antitoxin system VapC family toxin n=1 Tax=unclassified Methanoregula TaxID=2649730 RepID=UPI0009D2FA91|nr:MULTISPECIES: type II toxin-antitoxin system VapC family toxin [unclassified Methanoregula]OPX62889.1 MAG: tRNA(fMet)-specific endonuclease VapC [Methanoregula sp. PtaB.Bin085]OPY35326.1 MAG: tRNA(fMet)-specific endonuclease VapC [Methanoregula sp. PtaU1.Bin006]